MWLLSPAGLSPVTCRPVTTASGSCARMESTTSYEIRHRSRMGSCAKCVVSRTLGVEVQAMPLRIAKETSASRDPRLTRAMEDLGMLQLPAADLRHQRTAVITARVGEYQQHRLPASPQSVERDRFPIEPGEAEGRCPRPHRASLSLMASRIPRWMSSPVPLRSQPSPDPGGRCAETRGIRLSRRRRPSSHAAGPARVGCSARWHAFLDLIVKLT